MKMVTFDSVIFEIENAGFEVYPVGPDKMEIIGAQNGNALVIEASDTPAVQWFLNEDFDYTPRKVAEWLGFKPELPTLAA